MNTFLDFITCAEHLIYEGYTTADQLGIFGRSAGGLLVTAVANLRPDLFKVVLSDVPFCDVIGALSDPKVPVSTYRFEIPVLTKSSSGLFMNMTSGATLIKRIT